jgi:hypothetical protein
MGREEVQIPFRALLEWLRETYLGSPQAQVNERNARPSIARFKDDRPQVGLARVAPRLRRLSSCCLAASLVGEHGGLVYRRHRASGKTTVWWALSRRAIFALSRGIPTIGCAMLDLPAPHHGATERERRAEPLGPTGPPLCQLVRHMLTSPGTTSGRRCSRPNRQHMVGPRRSQGPWLPTLHWRWTR